MNRFRVLFSISFALILPFCGAAYQAAIGPISDSVRAELLDAKSRLMGSPEATVKIVVFVDYDCPSCRKIMPEFEREAAQAKHVAVYVHQMPMRQHRFGAPAAAIAESAQLRGIYPRVDKALLAGGPLTQERLNSIGGQYRLSTAQAGAASARLAEDKEQFSQLKLNFVPVFLVVRNGVAERYSWSDLKGRLGKL